MMENISKGFAKVTEKMAENSPGILLGVGIALFGTTVVLVAKETPKAHELMQEKRTEIADEDAPKPYVEKARIILAGSRAYVPAMATGALSIFCFVYANKIHMDKEAALIAAYTLSNKTLSQYKKAVQEKLGTRKAEEVKEEVARIQLRDNPVPSDKREIVVLGEDEHLCMDSWSGRYFKASVQQIREAEYQVNKEMVTGFERVIFLDTFYDALKIPCDAKVGETHGWDIEQGDRLEIHLREGEASDGRPCWVLEYDARALVVPDTNW